MIGESEVDYRARLDALELESRRDDQASRWDWASRVALIEVVRRDPLGGSVHTQRSSAVVRSIATLKGPSITHRFRIKTKPVGPSMCGGFAGDVVALAKPGETFVVFLTSGRPGNGTLIAAERPSRIVEARIRAGLDRLR